MLEKPAEYNEVPAQQGEAVIYAEDINKLISNIEKIKGGKANEAPLSNIKELKEALDNLKQGQGEITGSISADKVSFNNDNAGLDFSSKYDFPKFKNKLKERYELKLITDYSLDNAAHIDEVQDVYTLTLEKNENKYILKGSLNYNITAASDNLIFYIISIDNNKDFGHITSEIYQFINSGNNAEENEIVIEGLNNFKYNFMFYLGVPIFQIKKQDNSNFEIKDYNIALNIEIPEANIKNNQEFIPIVCGNSQPSFLRLKNINGKAVIKGEAKQITADTSFILFSHFALENYFDIKTDQNDSYYTEAGEMIKSNKGRTLKYYIRKTAEDMTNINNKLANISITVYYLEIKHSDNSNIEHNEILTFNLTAPKNADVQKIEAEKNIQNVLEILIRQLKDIMLHLSIGSEKTYFEKTEIDISMEGQTQHITSETLEDASKLYLEKKIDGCYYIKGSFKARSEGISAVRVKALSLEKSKLTAMIRDTLNNFMSFIIYKDNYIYLILNLQTISAGAYQEIKEYKIYDPNIICPMVPDTNSGTVIEEPFGIYLVNGKYRLKGKISYESHMPYLAAAVSEDIQLFFDNDYTGGGIRLNIQNGMINSKSVMIAFEDQYADRICDIECPKQPIIKDYLL